MAQQNDRRPEADPGRPAGFAAVLTASALALALWLGWGSANLLWQDLAFAAARTEVGFWGRDDYQPTMSTRVATEASLAALLSRAPAQPDYLTLAANLYAWQAYWADQPALQSAYRMRSVRAQYAAQKSRPAHRQGWQKMIRYAADTEGAEAWLRIAERRLAALAAGVRSQPAAGRNPTGYVNNSHNKAAN